MQKNDKQNNQLLNFKEQTPSILIGQKEQDLLYELAFLSCENMYGNECTQNTTTWD